VSQRDMPISERDKLIVLLQSKRRERSDCAQKMKILDDEIAALENARDQIDRAPWAALQKEARDV
jgi:hypothetical protein